MSDLKTFLTMKKLKLLLIAIVVGGLAGCDILDTEPRQSLPIDETLEDVQGLQGLVTGLYDGIQDPDIAGGNYNVVPEILADNVVWTGSFTNYQRVHQHGMVPENPTTNWWVISYRTINMANLLIEDAPNLIDDPDLSQEDLDVILGDAYFIRGMLYFEMARVFSSPWWVTGDGSHDGVPLRTNSATEINDFENLPRASLAASYVQAESDLQEALNFLPDVAVRADRRVTRSAALGYLMRLEMTRGNYSAAADYAGQIIDSGFYALTDHPEGPFLNEFSEESIFEVIHTPQDNPGVNAGQNAFYAASALGGRGDVEISGAFFDALNSLVTEEQQAAIEAADLVVEDLRVDLIAEFGGAPVTLKFRDGINNADNVMNMRYADILLSRAEALAEDAADLSSVPQEAYDLLNRVRTRSLNVTDPVTGAPMDEVIEFEESDFDDKQELIDAILLERQVELAFEGDRFHTLQRKGLDVRGTPAGDDALLFPLPQGEVDANPEIEQHGGY
jgi:starch-binding outer membrane protein, SusD/RagB family